MRKLLLIIVLAFFTGCASKGMYNTKPHVYRQPDPKHTLTEKVEKLPNQR